LRAFDLIDEPVIDKSRSAMRQSVESTVESTVRSIGAPDSTATRRSCPLASLFFSCRPLVLPTVEFPAIGWLAFARNAKPQAHFARCRVRRRDGLRTSGTNRKISPRLTVRFSGGMTRSEKNRISAVVRDGFESQSFESRSFGSLLGWRCARKSYAFDTKSFDTISIAGFCVFGGRKLQQRRTRLRGAVIARADFGRLDVPKNFGGCRNSGFFENSGLCDG
jgi:hypothetical protein